MDDPIFELGMLFNSGEDLKCAIINHKVKWGRKIYFEKNDKERVVGRCSKGGNCKWQVVGRVVPKTTTFQIRKLQEKHTCSRIMDSNVASSRYIAKKYLDDFRSERGINVYEFQEKLHQELNLNIPVSKIYKIKAEAKLLIEGKYKDQYRLLWDYCVELRATNPGSTVCLETGEDEKTGLLVFKRFYVCLRALRIGFLRGCRRIIGLDGTFLKGPHPGILLSAVGVDANNGIYPIVYAVVERESKATWKWFIEGLIDDLNIYKVEAWCIISDRQKVI